MAVSAVFAVIPVSHRLKQMFKGKNEWSIETGSLVFSEVTPVVKTYEKRLKKTHLKVKFAHKVMQTFRVQMNGYVFC